MQFTLNLAAGVTSKQQTAGSYFMILDDGGAGAVDVKLIDGTTTLEQLRTAAKGTKIRVPGGQFTAVELQTAVDATLQIVISNGLVDIDLFGGASVNATLVNPLPVPVSNDRGAPGNLLYVSGVSISDAPATSAPDNAAVACSAVIAQILAADATRRQITFTNIGNDPVTLGAAGHTWAKRCIIIASGDSYIEDRAANLAWYGICDAGKTASVTTKTVIA